MWCRTFPRQTALRKSMSGLVPQIALLMLLASCVPEPTPTPIAISVSTFQPTPAVAAGITLAPMRPPTEPDSPTRDQPSMTITPTVTLSPTSTETRTPTAVITTQGDGTVVREYWFNLEGFTPDDLRVAQWFPDTPDYCDLGTDLATTPDQGDNFGARLRGFITPPGTGEYRFWIGSDNGSEFWLSSDDIAANLQKRLDFDSYANYLDFDSAAEQGPIRIRLIAGERYYFEAFLKEDSSGFDWLAIAWQGPGIPERQVVGERYLSSDGFSCSRSAPHTRTLEANSTP